MKLAYLQTRSQQQERALETRCSLCCHITGTVPKNEETPCLSLKTLGDLVMQSFVSIEVCVSYSYIFLKCMLYNFHTVNLVTLP